MKQIILLIFCLGLCMQLGAGNLDERATEANQPFSDQVNLALRQLGHQLLQMEGDKRSTVLPVQITGANEFTLKLESDFNYDALPKLLHDALASYKIQDDYQVAIKTCKTDTLILGYNRTAFVQGKVPCVGRDRSIQCLNIVLTIASPTTLPAKPQSLLLPFLVLGLLAIIGFVLFWKRNKTPLSAPSKSDSTLTLGNFNFDYQNQMLQLGDQNQALTFRENKLLYFLASHANEVLKRDTLIAEVWGDEGVIVGRSLDVFISRLRKLLKGDERVLIKSIHGVGYRLEVEG